MALALTTASSPALGYGDRAAIDIQHFAPAREMRGWSRWIWRASALSPAGWVPQATAHYADRQLVLLCRGNCSPDVYVPWVAHRATLDLSFALSLFDRLQLALSCLVALYQHTDPAIIDAGSDAASSGGLVAVRPNPAGLGNLCCMAGWLPAAAQLALWPGTGRRGLACRPAMAIASWARACPIWSRGCSATLSSVASHSRHTSAPTSARQ